MHKYFVVNYAYFIVICPEPRLFYCIHNSKYCIIQLGVIIRVRRFLMFEVIRNKKHVVFTILDGCLSTATFLFSLYLFANLLKGKFEVAVFIILFFLLSASYII